MSAKGTYKMKANFDGLKKLEQAFTDAKNYKVQVGVLGNTTRRVEGDLTNADILLIHEQGVVSKNIPKRSVFNSIEIKKTDINADIGKIVSAMLKNQEPVFNAFFKIGLVVLKTLKGAFDTEGYGTWMPNAPATIKKKLAKVKGKNKAIAQVITMVDTGALERSLTFRVLKKVKSKITKQFEWTNKFKN